MGIMRSFIYLLSFMSLLLSCTSPHRKLEDEPVALDMVKDASSLGVRPAHKGVPDSESMSPSPNEASRNPGRL